MALSTKTKIALGITGLVVVSLLFSKRKTIMETLYGLTEAGKYDKLVDIVRKNGGVVGTGVSQKNVLGLRATTNTNVNQGKGAYDDKFFMFWVDAQGRKRVGEYAGNTEPSAMFRGQIGQDVNKDNKLDQGRLPAGFYEYRVAQSEKYRTHLAPVRDYTVDRDVNADGLFDARDAGATSGGGGSMLFHSGGMSSTGSAGCQTMPPSEFQRFIADVQSGGTNGNVAYTLLSVTSALA